MNRVTLDQWQALVSIVEAGGFAQAAERLHKSQSTVSYAVRTLEGRIGTPVFEILGRKAELTEAGQMLYRQARHLLRQAGDLESLASHLARGWEAEIRLAADVIFPVTLVFQALQAFEESCSTTRVEVHESVLSGTQDLLLGGEVDLAIVGQVPPGFVGTPLHAVEFRLVAAPEHPLHQTERVSLKDLEAHRHLVIRDSGSRRLDSGWLGSNKRWTVSTLHASIEAVSRGLGFAWLPVPHIAERLRRGQLKPIPLGDGARRQVMLHLVLSQPDAAGPATRRLAQLLSETCTGFSDETAPATR